MYKMSAASSDELAQAMARAMNEEKAQSNASDKIALEDAAKSISIAADILDRNGFHKHAEALTALLESL